MGNLDFTNLFVVLKDPASAPAAQTEDAIRKAGGVVLAFGNFITIAMNFVILGFIIFLMVKKTNRMNQAPKAAEAPAGPPATPEDIMLLREIRDSLRKT